MWCLPDDACRLTKGRASVQLPGHRSGWTLMTNSSKVQLPLGGAAPGSALGASVDGRRRGQEDLEAGMRAAFEPHNRQLANLLGRFVHTDDTRTSIMSPWLAPRTSFRPCASSLV